MIEQAFAEIFAKDWIEAWNKHDLDRILSHYDEDFEMSSPNIIKIADEPSGKLSGKKAVGEYWLKALKMIQDLQFELIQTLVRADSVTLYYRGARGRLAAEVFHLNPDRKIVRAYAPYA